MSGKFLRLTSPYQVEKDAPLGEYPRPHFIRDSFYNLNGYWDYAISKNMMVTKFDGKILVPFSPESSLSGVNRHLRSDEYLFYSRMVKLPPLFKKDILLLHFGAVDQQVDVFIDEQLVYSHDVAYIPFSVDISSHLAKESFTILLRVKDQTSSGLNLIGKQKEKRGGIWYTPQSGVWQTVWLESFPQKYLRGVEILPNLDHEELELFFDKVGSGSVEFKIYHQGQLVTKTLSDEKKIKLQIEQPKPWSPEHPNLYDVYLTFGEDKVHTYFAFRKIEKRIDKKGIARFYLNNRPYFQNGVLDQGYYADGLLTPPSDEAMINDIKLVKQLGFNMLRKHIKIEPLRFYYHCDRLGVLVWQDMVNLVASKYYNSIGLEAMLLDNHPHDVNTARFGVNSLKQRERYYHGLKTMINTLKFYPSIVTWVPFNEGWGQFDALAAIKVIKNIDQTRLIDHASGWSDQKAGDYYSRHIYFTKLRINSRLIKNRIIAITEFGGYSLSVTGHVFNVSKSFGYRNFKSKEKLVRAYEKLYLKQVKPLIKKGLSVAIYTQLSDVEDEVNGFITYDRKIVKVNLLEVAKINQQLYEEFNKYTLDD